MDSEAYRDMYDPTVRLERQVFNAMEMALDAAREAECLLMNYLATGKFPAGSDCDEVRIILHNTLDALDKVVASYQ